MFKNEGDRGNLTQASASDYDDKSGVLFLTQLNRDAVACWNTKKPLSPETLDLVAQDKEALIFTNDLKVGSACLFALKILLNALIPDRRR